MMISTFPLIEKTLRQKSIQSHSALSYFKLCLSYLEFIAPHEAALQTGKLIKLLTEYPEGLEREELLGLFYADYCCASFNRKASLKICLEKIIQRARLQFKEYNMTIFYCKKSQKYLLKLI